MALNIKHILRPATVLSPAQQSQTKGKPPRPDEYVVNQLFDIRPTQYNTFIGPLCFETVRAIGLDKGEWDVPGVSADSDELSHQNLAPASRQDKQLEKARKAELRKRSKALGVQRAYASGGESDSESESESESLAGSVFSVSRSLVSGSPPAFNFRAADLCSLNVL